LTFKTFDLRRIFNVSNTLVLIIYQTLLITHFYRISIFWCWGSGGRRLENRRLK